MLIVSVRYFHKLIFLTQCRKFNSRYNVEEFKEGSMEHPANNPRCRKERLCTYLEKKIARCGMRIAFTVWCASERDIIAILESAARISSSSARGIYPGRGLFAEYSGHADRSVQTATIKKGVITNPGTSVSTVAVHVHRHTHAHRAKRGT